MSPKGNARQPARTEFTAEEMRAFQRGRPVEFRDTRRWLRGIVIQGPHVDGQGCHYILVQSKDVSTRNVPNGEITQCRPGGVRPFVRG